MLLIYHAVELKTTFSGSNTVSMAALQHVKSEGGLWMLMQLRILLEWPRVEEGSRGAAPGFLPTVTESGGTSVDIRAVQYFIVSEGG